MSKSILDEINQTGESHFTRRIDACVLRRNYYALETSSIKESFDSDVFNFYEDSKYDNVEKPSAKTRRIDKFTIDYSFDDDNLNNNNNTNTYSSKDLSSDLDSFDSVISNFKSFEENPIITNTATTTKINALKLRQTNKNNNDDHSINSERLAHIERGGRGFYHGRASIASIEEIKQVQNKVKEINDLDYNVNSLIFKAVAVHTDILVRFANIYYDLQGLCKLKLL